jgi:hypothetical protein
MAALQGLLWTVLVLIQLTIPLARSSCSCSDEFRMVFCDVGTEASHLRELSTSACGGAALQLFWGGKWCPPEDLEDLLPQLQYFIYETLREPCRFECGCKIPPRLTDCTCGKQFLIPAFRFLCSAKFIF